MAWRATVLVTHEITVNSPRKPDAGEILARCYGNGDVTGVELTSTERVRSSPTRRRTRTDARRAPSPTPGSL